MKPYGDMTAQERTEHHFAQLCRRMLDVDPVCGHDKGCPHVFVVVPLLSAWRENASRRTPSAHVQATFDRMVAVSEDGRGCEFPSVAYHARKYLQEHELRAPSESLN